MENRGIAEDKEFAILTAEITKAAFGMKPSKYKQYKGLRQDRTSLFTERSETILRSL